MTAFRTGAGGRIDRSRPVSFTFDGKALTGLAGDTLASALLANGIHLVGRSFKYHRPRGILAAGVEEPNALVTVDRGDGRETPNLRATQVELFLDGLHTFEQTYRDLCNSVIHSHAGSVILLDDTLPSDPYSALPDQRRSLWYRQQAGLAGRNWHGDVYKVVAAVHSFHPALDYRTIVDSGNPQTLIWRGTRDPGRTAPLELDAISRMSYFDLLDHRELLREAAEDEAISDCVAALRVPRGNRSG